MSQKPKEKKIKKEVTLKLTQVVALNKELINMVKEPKIGFALKYQLVKLLEKTKIIVKDFNEQRNGIIKKYGECVDEKNNIWELVKEDTIGVANQEIIDLTEIEEVFNNQYSLKDFENIESGNSYIEIMKFMQE